MLDNEILADFQSESMTLITELSEIVEKIEDAEEFPAEELRNFSQRIDRIMGAAQTLTTMDATHSGLIRIGAIAQVCKQLGYKAAEIKAVNLIPLFAAFWADTIEVMGELITHVTDKTKSDDIAKSFAATLQNRLTWLAGKVNSNTTPTPGERTVSQLDVDQLLSLLNK